MKLLNSLSFALFLIFSILEPCAAFSQSDYLITDLESLDSSGFTNEANSWVYKGQPCPLCIFSLPSGSSCAQEAQTVYGGPDNPPGTGQQLFERSYSVSGAPWNNFGLEFELWAFTTSVLSSEPVLSIRMSNSGGYFGSSYLLISDCSTEYQSPLGSHIKYIYKYRVRTSPSSSPSNLINFQILKSSTSPAAIDSVGFRNVKIYNMGSVSSSSGVNFPCFDSRFWNGTGCQACQSTCTSCSGPNQGQCTVCKPTSYNYGNGICLLTPCTGGPYQLIGGTKNCTKKCSTGFYWARNSSCIEACEQPLVQSFDPNGGAPMCSSPCPDATQFIYPDGDCLSTCSPPLKQRNDTNFKLCLNPCQVIGFLYPDGSCEKTCPTYFRQKTEKNVKYCESPCPSTAKFVNPDGSCTQACDFSLTSITAHGIPSCISRCTEYVLPDDSCGACPAPFSKKIENNIQYCVNPCFHNKTFFYEDGTCQKNCPSPSIPKDHPSIGKICKFPCANVDHYYNNRNGKCTKTCEYTSVPIESPLPKICFSTLTEEEVKQVQEIADTANGANTASSTGAMIWSFISSSDSTAACLGPLAKMLQYIKFMDIRFPEKVLILMDAQSKDSGGFSTKMMKGALDKFPSHELPRKFKVYQASSSFFVNFWPALFNLSVILFVTGLVVFGTTKTKGRPKMNGIFKSLTEILKWNVFLITFSGSVGDIILFTALEFQTMQFDNVSAVFSFLLCSGINTLAILVVIQIIDVNSAIRRSKKRTQDEEEQKKMIEKQWNSYKALFECYKDYSFYQQIFLFVFLVRLGLLNAIIGYFYNYPLFQAATAVTSNILMLGYLVIKRPMKKLVNLVQQIVLEFVLLPFNVCVLALAIMDYHEIVDTDRRRSIGDVIVYINLIVPILSVVLIAAKAIVMGIDFYKSWKLAKADKIKKLESVQKGFRLNDYSSPSKNFPDDHTQILDLTDQPMISMEHTLENQRIEPLRSNFMSNRFHIQNLITPSQAVQNNRRRINKKRDHMGIDNYPLKIKFGN